MEHDVWIAIISGLTTSIVPNCQNHRCVAAKKSAVRWSQSNQRFPSINQRFDDMRELWRAELCQVEEGLDARLKHLE